MQRIHFSINIKAPREKVWQNMIGEETYQEWTRPFSPTGNSHFSGSWDKGSVIRFLGPDPETGKEGGMYSRIKDNRPYEFISIEHLGMIHDGQVDTTSSEVKKWVPAIENYTFKEKEGVTELLVDLDTSDEYKDMFNDTWPKSLHILKSLAEK